MHLLIQQIYVAKKINIKLLSTKVNSLIQRMDQGAIGSVKKFNKKKFINTI